MRITIITQSDPFFLAENIEYLIGKLPEHSKIVSAIVFNASPFASSKNTFLAKLRDTIIIFGIRFFIRYGIIYLSNKFRNKKNVQKTFEKHHIPLINLKYRINHPDSISKINKYKPDILISIAGNQIFREPILKLAPLGCLNLHTGLLPKYRGLFPSFWVLRNNENETGVSVFFVEKGIDSGPILVQRRIPISKDMSHKDLIKKSKRIGMDAILESIDLLHSGDYTCLPNKEEDMTYYSFPTRKDVREFYKMGKRFY